MSDSIVPASGPEAEQAGFVRPGLGELFVAFVKVALSSFGGALPWARRMIVDQKGWMTSQELVKAGQVKEALAALQGEVRAKPNDPKLRVFCSSC